MAITRTDRNQRWANSQLVSEEVVVVDVTTEVTRADLLSKATAALAVNATFLAIASPSNAQVLTQVQRLTRETNAIFRLLRAALVDNSLLVENTDT